MWCHPPLLLLLSSSPSDSHPPSHRRTRTIDPTNPKAEISALDASGRLPASAYAGATMYTTLSPCDMCTGACLLYKVARVVLGENETFVGGEAALRARGVAVVNVHSAEARVS